MAFSYKIFNKNLYTTSLLKIFDQIIGESLIGTSY